MIFINKELLINDEIKVAEVRLVDSEGNQIGVVSKEEALKTASDKGLDLVNISPNSVPPVCKIMNYGKYKYEQSKKEKQNRKNQQIVNTKEIRLRTTIEDHDLQVKVKSAIKFLESGDKVKLTLRFRGREISNQESGTKLLEKFTTQVNAVGLIDSKPKLEGKNLVIHINPRK